MAAQGDSTKGASEPVATAGEAPSFVVVPAVDLLGEEAVRLVQGDYARVSLRAGEPAELVARFAAAGPALIHLVDLEGARSGRMRPELVRRLVAAAGGVPVQASGGIRSPDDAETLLAAGAARVVVGTAAFADPDALGRLATALGERLVVAVDARDGLVAVSGWERGTGVPVVEAAARCAEAGVPRLLCTAVERDGTLGGPDLELLARVRDASGLPVLAAGGIRSTDDLARLAAAGLEGAIVGRALLEGRIPLAALGAGRGPAGAGSRA
jgi:phosphoribosylformimino-5-aminoimidazole carboxamide ribotide isomerase